MSLSHIVSELAPPPQGAYSHAVRAGELLFCSTQLPLDPRSGELAGSGAYEQARCCLSNLEAVCAAGGTALAHAVRLTVYLSDRIVLPEVDRAFREKFGEALPARVPVHVVSLARGALVSMDAIVAVGASADPAPARA
ncbi:MAG TPA: Rid family hydrolase [Solirubrobacteraceae bacterium]|nr:Rid family hydrolase [Solirubrobacteraceae bacterium]